MSDEITFGFAIGRTLTYGVYTAAGGVRTAAGTSLPETAGTGYYHADNGDIVASDIVIVKEGAVPVGWGEYLPRVISESEAGETLDDVIDEIDANEALLNQVIEDLLAINSDYDERPPGKIAQVIIN